MILCIKPVNVSASLSSVSHSSQLTEPKEAAVGTLIYRSEVQVTTYCSDGHLRWGRLVGLSLSLWGLHQYWIDSVGMEVSCGMPSWLLLEWLLLERNSHTCG